MFNANCHASCKQAASSAIDCYGMFSPKGLAPHSFQHKNLRATERFGTDVTREWYMTIGGVLCRQGCGMYFFAIDSIEFFHRSPSSREQYPRAGSLSLDASRSSIGRLAMAVIDLCIPTSTTSLD